MISTKYLNTVLTAIALLLALNLWVGIHDAPASSAIEPANEAHAQGRVDAGQQRAAMIEELKGLNGKIDTLSKKLGDGSVKVKVEGDAGKD